METRLKSIFDTCYLLCCLVATVVLIFKCFQNFWQDKDTSQISFKIYNSDNDNIYPSISICFDWPITKENYYYNYTNFLAGSHWDTQFLEVDYDNVSINLESNLFLVVIKYTNGDEKRYDFIHKNVA